MDTPGMGNNSLINGIKLFNSSSIEILEFFSNEEIASGRRVTYEPKAEGGYKPHLEPTREITATSWKIIDGPAYLLGHLTQDASKHYNSLCYGYIFDKRKVLSITTEWFDQFQLQLNELEKSFADSINDTTSDHFNDLNESRQKLQYCLSLLKANITAFDSLCGTVENGLGCGSIRNKANPGYLLGLSKVDEGPSQATMITSYQALQERLKHQIDQGGKILTDIKSKLKAYGYAVEEQSLANIPNHHLMNMATNLLNQMPGIETVAKVAGAATHATTGAAGMAVAVASGAVDLAGKAADALWDGNHSWKQTKWHVILQQIAIALEQEMGGQTLGEIILTLKSYSSTEEKATKLIHALELLDKSRAEMNTTDNKRKIFHEFISTFNESCSLFIQENNLKKPLSNTDTEFNKIIKGISFVCRTNVNISHLSDYILQKTLTTYAPKVPGYIPTNKLQEKDFLCIGQIDSTLGGNGVTASSQKRSDVPFTLGKFTLGGKEAMLVHHPIPTTAEGISPDYEAFILACQEKGIKIVYVSLRKDENLIALAKKYRDVFNLFVFDNESEWYKQSAGSWLSETKFAEEMDTEEFTSSLAERMIGHKGYFFAPVIEQAHINEINKAIRLTSKFMFGEKAPLTLLPQERQIFIDMTHAVLGLALPGLVNQRTGTHNSCILNYTSTEEINDGAMLLLLATKLLFNAQGHAREPEYEALLQKFAHSAALLVKKGAVSGPSKDRGWQAFNFMDQAHVIQSMPEVAQELPIDLKGGFETTQVTGQRPGEKGFVDFATNLSLNFKGVFDKDLSDQLHDEYINNDLFFDFTAGQRFKKVLDIRHTIQAQFSPKMNAASLTGAEKKKLSQFMTEMLYFIYLNPTMKDEKIMNFFTPEYFTKLLTTKQNDLKEFIKSIDDGCFDMKKTAAQRMFRLCLLNIPYPTDIFIKKDRLFDIVENSPHLASFMNVAITTPENCVFKNVISGSSNILEMLILGELTVAGKFKAINYQEAEKKVHTLEDKELKDKMYKVTGTFRYIREKIELMAKGEISTDKIPQLIACWQEVMALLK